MFRIICSIAFLAVCVGIVLHYIIFAVRSDQTIFCKKWHRPISIAKTLLFFDRHLSPVEILRKLIYLLTLLCFVVLVITGFYPPLILGESICGYLLMAHVTAAGVFAVCITALTIMWADNCRFDKNYWPWLLRIVRHEPANNSAAEKYEPGLKVCFWIIIVLSLSLILSSLLAMFSLFGTEGQKVLLQLHRYCAILMVLAAVLHTYLLVLTHAKK